MSISNFGGFVNIICDECGEEAETGFLTFMKLKKTPKEMVGFIKMAKTFALNVKKKMSQTKKIKLTKEEFEALLIAMRSDELFGNVAPVYEDVKIEFTIKVENWGMWESGQAGCWAWGIGQWLQKYRWKNVNGLLRNLKKRLEGLYKDNKLK